MPNSLSKFCASQLNLQLCHAECHELSHTWNPNCILAIWDALGPSLIFCAKTYGFLYLFKALFDKRGRVNEVNWSKWLAKTIRSSLFLTSTEILFMFWLCAFRRLLGFATWPTISFVNGFVACSISIWIESQQRRKMLIPYLLNLASEAIFRQTQHRHMIRPIPYGESLIFGFSVGAIIILLENFGRSHRDSKNNNSSAAFLRSLLQQILGIQGDQERKTTSSNALKIASRNFLASFSLLSLHGLLRRIYSGRKLQNSLRSSLRLPLFLGSMPLLFQLFSRISQNVFKSNLRSNATAALLSSSSAMAIFWPNNTLALYSFWKMVELALSAQLIPALPGGDVLLFSLLSSYLLGLAVLEPHALRPSYYKFLCSLTGNRLQLFNRPLFDKFFATSSSSRIHSHFRPDNLMSPKLLSINPAFYCSPKHF